ncbi:glutathione synthase/ribosomal protein S6 modification enzyme (glutaminyl transferase) [Halovivax ruber XH-70]|uniref:Glutathione synthase/ribosomal protein S6 modification enzyme (Glutaminyl transferase) n=1 Tax=Halovivax ruber (strain DSM 18193 / JCM 13892 / XH-70) TaxID=797302 RepID=L0IA14_HALRX|nr:RimK family alpha-L-glutamate ligase [Halovivax ruber]AGB15086.1 glutathione synthase/ribosomal protein S6 modification enzyme (glutaminyl transferase) [Halovivax ruber XH-70]
MLELAVANREETFERMREPLAERGIRARHVPVRERVIPLDGDAPIDATEFDVGFVYPGRLMEGGVADAMLDVPWVNGLEAVATSRNKAGVLARLDRAGLPVPDSVYVSNPVDESELVDVYDRFESPVVVKPNSTTRGVGVAKAHDLDSFLGVCDYLGLVQDYKATGDKSFLVQEYLPDATDYRVMVLDGEYVGAVERRLPDGAREAGQWKHNVHRGAEAQGVELSGERRKLAESAARALDIDLLGVDLLATDDRVVVTETNARPTIDAATKYEPDFYDRLAATIEARADLG